MYSPTQHRGLFTPTHSLFTGILLFYYFTNRVVYWTWIRLGFIATNSVIYLLSG